MTLASMAPEFAVRCARWVYVELLSLPVVDPRFAAYISFQKEPKERYQVLPAKRGYYRTRAKKEIQFDGTYRRKD